MEFWEKFLNCAINKGVGEEHAKWYVNWGVRFARSIRGVPLKERSLEDVRLFHMESWSSESQMHTNKKTDFNAGNWKSGTHYSLG